MQKCFACNSFPTLFRNDPIANQYNSLGREKFKYTEPIKLEEPDAFDDKFANSVSSGAPSTAASTTKNE